MNRIVLLFAIGILSLSLSFSQNNPFTLYATDTVPNLIPPSGFTASSDSNLVTLSWNIPYDSVAGQVPFNLVGFNVYRNDTILLSCGNQSNTLIISSYNGVQVYSITGVYDLTPYGLPGTTGESEIVFADTLEVAYGFAFPFSENWNSGSVSTQFWNAENGWNVIGQFGYPSPSVCFDGSPGFTQYWRSLESFWINAAAITTTTPYSIHLDFDLKLMDQSVTQGTENLSVEVWNGTAWSQAASFVNQGTMIQWEHQSVDISYWTRNQAFKIRFLASGIHSSPIIWWIDNIQVTWQLHLNPPINLNAMLMGVPFNDAHLTWERPTGFNDIIHYVLDDNSAEDAWAIDNGYDAWLGNEFNVTESGGIVSVDVYWQSNPGSGDEPLTIDIFNSNLELVGSSDPFIPVWDS